MTARPPILRCLLFAVAALAASAVGLTPAAAADDDLPSDPYTQPGDQIGTTDDPLTETDPADPMSPSGNGNTETGPVGHTGVPTFEAVRLPGEVIPSSLSVEVPANDVDLVTIQAVDDSFFAALLVINSAEASTKYHFDEAIPAGHTAVVQADGSIMIVGGDDEPAGQIEAPWAFDSEGKPVQTSFVLDDGTLVQTIEHHGASYPVVADPNWKKIIRGVVTAAAGVAVITTAVAACAGAGAICAGYMIAANTPAVVQVVNSVISIAEGAREPTPPRPPKKRPPRRVCPTSARTAAACK